MNEWPETHDSLIVKVKDPANEIAWSQFLAVYQPVVYRLARRRGLQHSDADDLVQGVFLSVSGAIGRWEPGAEAPRFRNWIGRIARNAIYNALSRRRIDQATGSTSVRDLLVSTPSRGNAMERELLNETRMEAFRWAAREVQSEFTDLTWSLFCETAIHARPVAEVAEEFGRSTGAVYVARCRVMQRIKEKVNELSDILSVEP